MTTLDKILLPIMLNKTFDKEEIISFYLKYVQPNRTNWHYRSIGNAGIRVTYKIRVCWEKYGFIDGGAKVAQDALAWYKNIVFRALRDNYCECQKLPIYKKSHLYYNGFKLIRLKEVI
jgi:hypothetical protein